MAMTRSERNPTGEVLTQVEVVLLCIGRSKALDDLSQHCEFANGLAILKVSR